MLTTKHNTNTKFEKKELERKKIERLLIELIFESILYYLG